MLARVPHIGYSWSVFRFNEASGKLTFDPAAPEKSTLSVSVKTESITSNVKGFAYELAGDKFLKAAKFPEATFVLTEPIAIEGAPASGETIAATAVGDLTIHGVTNRVELALEGQFVDGVVVVVGSTVILLADYDIEKPSAMSVLSVSDQATMEMQLVFTRG